MNGPGVRAVERLARKQAASTVKICPRCGRELVDRGDGLRCRGCGETPNDCRRCSSIVVDDGAGRFVRFRRITEDGQVEAEEV